MIGTASREVQLVATRADYGQTITSGFFRLTLNYDSVTDFDVETLSRTPRIPFDATADQMKAALELLENIDIVEVRRFGPFAQNTYEWKITLDWRIPVGTGAGNGTNIGVTGTGMGIGSVGAIAPSGFGTVGDTIRGNLPLLVVIHDDSFDVTGLGGRGAAWVRELRRGSKGPEFCEVTCAHVVHALTPGTQYQFRVRARNAAGWGEWSGATDVIAMPPMQPPSRPEAPKLLSALPNAISLLLVTQSFTFCFVTIEPRRVSLRACGGVSQACALLPVPPGT